MKRSDVFYIIVGRLIGVAIGIIGGFIIYYR